MVVKGRLSTMRQNKSKKKTSLPSRISAEHCSKKNDKTSSARRRSSPERRSAKESRRQTGRGSSRRSKAMSPSGGGPRLPLSPRSSTAAKSPTSIKSQTSSFSRRSKIEPLLSDDELRIAVTTSSKIEKSTENYTPPVAGNRSAVETENPKSLASGASSPRKLKPPSEITARVAQTKQYKPQPVAETASIEDSAENDRYELAESKLAAASQGMFEVKNITINETSPTGQHRGSSALEAGLFTDGSGTFGTDTYASDTFADEMSFSFESHQRPKKKSYRKYRFSRSWVTTDASSFDDVSVIVKQRVAWGCIFLSAVQFAILTTQVLMCGIAKLNINPTIGPYPDAFSEWGGKNAYLLVEGHQYFRLVTPTFLHVGYLHFLMNAFFQLETCAYLEREWGFNVWIFIYLASGLGSCLAASAIDPNVIGVCSSGALMGLFGARIAQAIVWYSFEPRHEYIGQGALLFERLGGIVCSAAVVFLLTFLTYIDWSGHLGGLATGFLVGLVVFPFALEGRSTKAVLRFTGVLGLLIGGVVLGVLLFHYAELDEELANACNYFRSLYTEGYNCECQAFD
ncbi:unnamed protein product [Pseudo-nitzschia multistriata]|uniref:rhomboid protease n=1 Tax=Pseudo-nitzschia multistriata TaxID=183589 RepID=A0A448ZCD5_9STRA|nr:unnamed protein product [Pseudo-nitzschia multistriata]